MAAEAPVLIKAIAVAPKVDAAKVVGTVLLDHAERHRRRIILSTEEGLPFLLDLRKAVAIRGGEGLVLEDGQVVAVLAKPELLMEIRARSPLHLARLAWHIGNRHLAAEIRPDAILILPDHVIAEMLRGLGADVRDVTAAFEPEGGAYAAHVHLTETASATSGHGPR